MRITNRLLAIGATVALPALGLVTFGASPVHAAQTLTVTTTVDENGPLTDCTDGQPGTNCSVREALAAATTAGDIVELQPGSTYLLSLGQLVHGDTSLTIAGNGATLDGRHTQRVLSHGTGTLTVEDLTIANGYASSGLLDMNGGGVEAQGDVTLDSVTLSENEVHTPSMARGGGVYAGGALSMNGGSATGNEARSDGDFGTNGRGGALYGDTVTATGVTFSQNEAYSSPENLFGEGGAIYGADSVVVSSSTFTGNTTGPGGYGGATYAAHTATITNSVLGANTSGSGGAIFATGDLDLAGSVLLANRGEFEGETAQGGAAATLGDLTAQSVLVQGNILYGIHASGGGLFAAGAAAISNSTVTSNTATSSPDAVRRTFGGGVYGGFGVTLDESSVTGNTAATGGHGGGVYAASRGVTATNSTIAYNTAATDPNSDPPGEGGGISAPSIALRFSSLAGNAAAVGANVSTQSLQSAASVVAYATGGGADCSVGLTSSAGYSFDDDGSCAFTAAHDTSAGPDPLLAPLADNGGPTPTMHPLPGSPLIDAIPTGSCIGCDATDQRGVARPQGSGYDIGAVEVIGGVAVSPRFTG